MDSSTGANGTVYCTNCGHKLAPDDQFCPECGTPRPIFSPRSTTPPEYTSSVTTATMLGEFTGAPPMMVGTMGPPAAGVSSPLLQYDVEYPDHLSRLLIFVKWLLIIPHVIVLMFLGVALAVVTVLAFFAILFTGRYPRGMWDFSLGVLRWTANVNAYTNLQRDEYPPFSGSEPYPVHLDLAYPERLSRLLIFVKWLLVIPSVIVYWVISWIAGIVAFLAFFAILFTGRYPRSLFDFTTGTMRWGNRITAYLMLLTDAYPPFRMSP
jgi:hypothetical protein